MNFNNNENKINENNNICPYCGNPLNQNNNKKTSNIIKIIIIILFISYTTIITIFLLKEIIQKRLDDNNKQNNNIVEDTNKKDETNDIFEDNKKEDTLDNNTTEEKNEEETKNNNEENKQPTNQKPNSNNSNTTDKKENDQNNSTPDKEEKPNNTPPKEEISKEKQIIGIWKEVNNPDALVVTENEILEIRTEINRINTYKYKIDEEYIILNEIKYIEFDIKDNTLYLNGSILKKQDNNYKLPNIYYNHNALYGTWKLESNTKTILLENGIEKTLNDEMIITKDNTSGLGSCGGSGCNYYIINFNNTNPELYTGNLCYELVDKNTLKQIKCHSDLIIGHSQWEDETLHNIIYKKVN